MRETLTVSSIWGIATRSVAAAGDTAAAVEYYRLAAGVGHASALFSFGVCCNIGNCVAEDKAAAVEYNRRSADTGDASALFNVRFSTTSATPSPRTRGRR
jgi:TPR repeat protein